LPSSRVTPCRVFDTTGLDFAGPIEILNRKGRGAKSTKGYIVIFICFVTRAIHIELTGDLSSASFLSALKRFCSRRGKPTTIYSDNGRNIVKVNKYLKDTLQNLISKQNDDVMIRYLTAEGIEWKFNPPGAPHFGGLWEAGIKSIKYHLKRVIGNSRLTLEEMMTLLCQVEACLNSRPLTAMSTDPKDFRVLTPGHFLIGGPLNSIPEQTITNEGMSHLTRWQMVTKMFQHFWKRWSQEYLTRLQQRPKWIEPKKNFAVGDIVLMKDSNIMELKWKLGRITKIHPGSDDRVRVVTLETANSIYTRPITKICLLPISK